MREIISGLYEAFLLLISFNEEIYGIVFLSLYVSLTSTLISTIIAVPLGTALGINEFKGKNIIVRLIYTFMSLPPVIAGLFVFLIIMRKGPLGYLRLSFTPTAMIIAQTCIVVPIIIGLTYNGIKEKGSTIKELGTTLGANNYQTLLLLIFEMRMVILAAVVAGFGRAISEVGAVMIVGGNIKGHTRVMTTFIAMLQNMGEYSMAIAVGIILLFLSFVINGILFNLQQK